MRGLETAVKAKLLAADNGLDCRRNAVVVPCQLRDYFMNEWLIGKLYRPAHGESQQLSAELLEEIVPAARQQIPAQAVNSVELRSVFKPHFGVGRLSNQVGFTVAADRVERCLLYTSDAADE